MLDELKRCNEQESTRIHYVIIWASSRWARNTQDHFRTHDLVKAAGARLVSITEPMIGEDTPESFYFEGMQAVNNQYESMKTSRGVRQGLHRKAMAGGSYGGRRLGYIKRIEQLPDGRQVSAPALDPDRHHFVTLAFELYDSGEYSICASCTAWACAATQRAAIPKARSAPPPCSVCCATPTTPASSSTSAAHQTKRSTRAAIPA
jgi:DNA invertase Pin-like site-specific DNA recombinase